jgi:hypothetical protein
VSQDQFITREQLSQAAKLGAPLPGFEKIPKPEAIIEDSLADQPQPTPPEEPEVEPAPLFSVSPNLTTDTASATIILDRVASIDDLSGAITETGEWLRTGAIELPVLSTNTGEFEAILDAANTDQALEIDSVSGSVSSVEPLSATGVVGRSARLNLLPVKLPKSHNQVYLVTAISVSVVTLAALVLGAYMLGIF